MKTAEHCTGCRNNFYNGNNSLGVARCWSLESAKMVTKFELGCNVPMNIREAYIKVRVPSCYHKNGYVYLAAIPSYAQTKAQRDAEREARAAEHEAIHGDAGNPTFSGTHDN